MNKVAALIGALVLAGGGYYLGNANRPEPTVIKVPEAPKEAFSSEGTAELAAAGEAFQGRFELVEGEVLNADEVRGRGYLNFGRDWRQDFTASFAPEEDE